MRLRAEDGRGDYDVQPFTVEVVSQDENADPEITSQPASLVAVVDRLYRYDLTAIDPDGEDVFWRFNSKPPEGMLLDFITGTLTWTPDEDHVGQTDVWVEALDLYGGSDTQEFEILVRGNNLPPAIDSTPLTAWRTGELYVYQVQANDPEGGPLVFDVSGTDPAGQPIPASDITIDEAGAIRFTPTVVGSYRLTATATDDIGDSKSQLWTLVVSDGSVPAADEPPYFFVGPDQYKAGVGDRYSQFLQARDPEGQAVTYGLLVKPPFHPDAPVGMPAASEMTIDPATGEIVWTPHAWHLTNNDARYEVVATATAGGKTVALQYFVTVTEANIAPEITSTGPTTVIAGRTYLYPVKADDPNQDDDLTYSLQLPQDGVSITPRSGLVTWPTTPDMAGQTRRLEILVSDGRGGEDSQIVETVLVVADTESPKVDLRATRTLLRVGEQVTVVATATDNVDVTSLELLVDGAPVALSGEGSAVLTFDSVGPHTVLAVATDAAGNPPGTATLDLIVADTSGAPVLTIASPDKDPADPEVDDGAIVTTVTHVIGSVEDTDLASWRLDLYTPDGTHLKQLGGGTTVQPAGSTLSNLAPFDPTILPNGPYVLRLEAVDLGGGFAGTSVLQREVHVDGNLKLGNFRLSFTDLTVPVAGIPITVTRTYDTLLAAQDALSGFRLRPAFVIRPRLVGIQAEQPQVDVPDRLAFRRSRQVDEEHTVEPLGPRELRRQPSDIVAGGDQEHVARVVIEPREPAGPWLRWMPRRPRRLRRDRVRYPRRPAATPARGTIA